MMALLGGPGDPSAHSHMAPLILTGAGLTLPQHLRAGKLLRLREQAATTPDPAPLMPMAPV